MAAPAPRLTSAPFSPWPVLLVLPALTAYLAPGAEHLLVYDRGAILHGELWRLVTGHWVHFSPGQLFWDAGVLAVTARLIEWRGCHRFPVVCLLSAPAMSLAMLLFLPDLVRYGGLSGLALTGTVFWGLQEWREAANRDWLGPAVLLLVLAKLGFELTSGCTLFVDYASGPVSPVPLSHLFGALCGVAGYFWPAKTGIRRKAGARTG